jgi:CRP-like cAMP-binding protein
VLLQQGTVPEAVVYLRRGQVVLSSSAASGAEVSCAVRGPDTMLGLELVLGHPMPYQVWALTDVAYCTLDRDAAEAWIGERTTPAGAALTYSLEEAARRVGERQALQGPALRRVARFLLQHTEAEGSDGEPLKTPHRVLAGMLGMRPETLSRSLADLRTAGALARGRTVHVSNLERLRELAD